MEPEIITKRWNEFSLNLRSLLPKRDLSVLDKVSITIDDKNKSITLICPQVFCDLIEKELSKEEFEVFKQCKNAHFGIDFKICYSIKEETPVKCAIHESRNIFMDRNLSRNPTAFQIFGEDSTLAFHILLYIFKYNIPIDLYGNTRIDPYDFAVFSGFTRTYLFHNVEEPEQLKRWLRTNKRNRKEYTENDYTEAKQKCVEKEGYLFTTVLENVLYRMMSEPLVFGREIKSSIYGNEHMAIRKEGDSIIRVEAIQLIKNMNIVTFNERGGKSKKYYDVKFDELLRTNMLEWFSILNDNPVRKAIETNKRETMPFYAWIQDLREICRKKGEASIKPEFDLVIKQAGINNSLEPKYQRRKLITLFNSVMSYDESMVLKLTNKGRYQYQPVFMFINNMNVGKEINEHKRNLCYLDFMTILKCYINLASKIALMNITNKIWNYFMNG